MSETPTEIDRQKKDNTGEKVFDFLQRTHFLEVRQSDEKFNDWIQALSYEQYEDYLTRLNGIIRGVPIHERKIDGQNVEVAFGIMHDTAYLPPYPDQKVDLMKQSFDTFKQLGNNVDRALLTYYVIQALHPYSDGNGRTGRLLYEIISADCKDLTAESLSHLLDHNETGHAGTGQGREIFSQEVLDPNSAYYYINREVAKQMFGDEFLQQYGSIYLDAPSGVGFIPQDVKQRLSPQEVKAAESILGEGDVKHFPFRGIVLTQLLSENPDLKKYFYNSDNLLTAGRKVTSEDIGKKFLSIYAEDCMDNLTEHDVRRLIEIHRDVKQRFITTLIDIFANPENHTIQTPNNTGPIPISRIFSRK